MFKLRGRSITYRLLPNNKYAKRTEWTRENQFFTWLSHNEQVGVKWMCTTRCSARKSLSPLA